MHKRFCDVIDLDQCASIRRSHCDVRFVPQADISQLVRSSYRRAGEGEFTDCRESGLPVFGTERRAASPRQPRCAAPTGNVISKTDPRPTAERAERRPSCASTIERQIDKPIPMPCGFVVKNGSKMRLTSFESIPDPESSTAITTLPGEYDVEVTWSSLWPSVTESIASIALVIRLSITCCNWIRLASTGGISSGKSLRTMTRFSCACPDPSSNTSRMS